MNRESRRSRGVASDPRRMEISRRPAQPLRLPRERVLAHYRDRLLDTGVCDRDDGQVRKHSKPTRNYSLAGLKRELGNSVVWTDDRINELWAKQSVIQKVRRGTRMVFDRVISLTSTERFWLHVMKSDEPMGCWRWVASCKSHNGVPQFWWTFPDGAYRCVSAYLVSWILAGKSIEPNKCFRHQCLSLSCVRPDHMVLVTHRRKRPV